jgi:hypothetical protein
MNYLDKILKIKNQIESDNRVASKVGDITLIRLAKAIINETDKAWLQNKITRLEVAKADEKRIKDAVGDNRKKIKFNI